ncbi:MAG: alpha-glucosidase [Anaerolineales bacterium]|nr:MAG: alpha-glucosidase [Anaerolineales bacterium]
MKTPWYHNTTIYQIYPRSFYDSNGDGIGDLQGILQKLEYVQELGFETLWISPFFASPQADTGYDISDYTDIAPEYGTMEDALQLIEQVHKRGMRIVFDMVLNHTSDQHPWFRESRSSRDNPKADWYIWQPPSNSPHPARAGWGEGKPNNWQSMTGGNGWHYAAERGQYYWASFLPFQPDLNYRNPEVKKTMLDIVRFWLGKGVDGFRLDIFNVIYKDAGFRKNPFSFKLVPTEDDPSGFFQEAKYNLNQPESFEFARELRSVCDEFGDRMLLGEVSGDRNIIRRFLGDESNNGLGLVFDFGMLNFKFSAGYFRNLLQEMETHYPDPYMPVYVFSNHDRHRSILRLGNDIRKAKLLAMFQLTVRGVPCLYYGEELGLTDLPMPFASAHDPIPHKFKSIPRFVFDRLGLLINRDEVRTPMQWDGKKNAGFSSATGTWLPIHENYKEINVEMQSGDERSLMNTIRGLVKLRGEHFPLREGSLELLDGLPRGVLGYRRIVDGEKIVVVMNFDEDGKQIPLKAAKRLMSLTENDQVGDESIHLGGFGGMIFESVRRI